ncbi:von willebrand factor type A domain-containing protein [Ditylenchus destructor]|uniref:von willebrand factor type A domain-containing protein n=1 Tax=Ditylenchus destructor TaxID=166010 RepID=A0AAD4MKN4_9BILA|nr:von willebrand factor type A domain-containing protein [Ditylenchus destructor]
MGFAEKCHWPLSDTLFILDSTVNVGGAAKHQKVLEFVADVSEIILGTKHDGNRVKEELAGSNLAVAQFTPEAKYEFGFLQDTNLERVERRIQNIPYLPCLNLIYCQPTAATLNSLISWASRTEEGNRAHIPDVVVLVTSSQYRPPELKFGEMLVKPQSPIHVFTITVGSGPPSGSALKPLQFAATTVNLAVLDFNALKDLVDPLCESVQSFLGEDTPTEPETRAEFLRGPLCILCISAVSVISAVTILGLCYAICRYKDELDHLRHQLNYERENSKMRGYGFSQNSENSRPKEPRRSMFGMAEITLPAEKKAVPVEPRKDESVPKEASALSLKPPPQHKEEKKTTTHHLPDTLSVPRGPVGRDRSSHRGKPRPEAEKSPHSIRDRGVSDVSRIGGASSDNLNVQIPEAALKKNQEMPREQRNIKEERKSEEGSIPEPTKILHAHENVFYFEPEAREEYNEEDDPLFDRSMTHLHHEHPALFLPPVDVLLLVDASSSIGINNFEKVKSFLRQFTNDIDVSPGRSRVAAILFANDPIVAFDFGQYYTNKSVRAAIRRMPYLGGSTFLAKALSFAAGMFWREQNMKAVRHKHRFMPTPRHDRLQVMVVISDGISDDNFDQQATHLHERMLVKISAVVTKSYNRERMRPITRYDGAIFLLTDKEALSIWLWHAQKMWNEHFGNFVEKEKSYRDGTYGMSNLSGRDPELGQSSMESGISLGDGPSHRASSRFK